MKKYQFGAKLKGNMTLIIGAVAKNGLLLASDSKSVFEDKLQSFNESAEKVFEINSHVGVLVAGDAYYAVPIIEQMKKDNKEHLDGSSVKEIADELVRITDIKYLEWSKNPLNQVGLQLSSQNVIAQHILSQMPQQQFSVKNPLPTFAFVVVGYEKDKDNHFTIPKIYSFNVGDHLAQDRTSQHFYCEGISEIAQYLFKRLYSKDKNIEDLTQLAAFAIEETSRVSNGVGGPLHILQIKEDGTSKKLNPEESKKTISDNKTKVEKLEKIFE